MERPVGAGTVSQARRQKMRAKALAREAAEAAAAAAATPAGAAPTPANPCQKESATPCQREFGQSQAEKAKEAPWAGERRKQLQQQQQQSAGEGFAKECKS